MRERGVRRADSYGILVSVTQGVALGEMMPLPEEQACLKKDRVGFRAC